MNMNMNNEYESYTIGIIFKLNELANLGTKHSSETPPFTEILTLLLTDFFLNN